VEQLQYKNITFTAWDIGARDKMVRALLYYVFLLLETVLV